MAARVHTVSGGTLRVLTGGAPTFGKPTPPLGTSIVPGDGSVVVAWQKPTTDGGSPITGYMLTGTPPTGSAVTSSVSASATSATLGGLVNGIDWAIAVAAATAQGTGSPSFPYVAHPTSGGATITKPTAADTGCRIARNSLTVISAATVSNATKGANPTRTWTGYLIQGNVNVQCTGAVFTDCTFESAVPGTRAGYYLINGSDHTQVRYCTFNGLGSVTGGSIDVGVQLPTNCLLYRCDISGCIDGMHLGSSGQITENYIHGPVAPAGSHSDGVQLINSITGLYFARNNIDVSDGQGGINSAMQFGGFAAGAAVDDFVIENNWFNGGGYTISGGYATTPVGGTVVVRNNRFGLANAYSSVVHPASAAQWIVPTNVWDVTGTTTGTGRAVTAGTAIS